MNVILNKCYITTAILGIILLLNNCHSQALKNMYKVRQDRTAEGKKSWGKFENSVFFKGLFAWTKGILSWGNHRRKCRIHSKANWDLRVQAKCTLKSAFKITVRLKVWCLPDHWIILSGTNFHVRTVFTDFIVATIREKGCVVHRIFRRLKESSLDTRSYTEKTQVEKMRNNPG